MWPLAAVFMVPLWWALERLRVRGGWAAPLAGLLFGATAYAVGYPWLWRLVDVFLAGDALLGGALWLAHGSWFALGFGLYAALYARVRARGWPVGLAAAAPLLVLEWLQLQIFPLYAGASLASVAPLVQIADLGGPLLLSAFVLALDLTAFATLEWAAGRRARPLAHWIGALGLVAAVWLYGAVRTAEVEARMQGAPTLRVGVVQPDLGVLEKRGQARRVHAEHVAMTRALLAEGALDLVIWPETAELRAIRGPLPVSGRFVSEDLGVPLLFGGTFVFEAEGRRAQANSVFLVESDGMIRQRYEKNWLIPLAESVPLPRLLPSLASRLPHAQAFRAATDTPAFDLAGLRLSTPICYEVVRPAFVRRMVRSEDPHLLVTLANDAWFGDSQEPWIHLQLARLRAVEHRRPLVRATNSGISALIDPVGRIVARTDVLSRATLRGTVHALDGQTLYTRLGDWPGWLAAAFLLPALLLGRGAPTPETTSAS
jgi:apolipoprotein N-acyltransferase